MILRGRREGSKCQFMSLYKTLLSRLFNDFQVLSEAPSSSVMFAVCTIT